jgi:glycosyltransferase involved in cell wall biosynthesis
MILSIVVPCYNEEEVLPETSRRLGNLLDRMVLHGKIDAKSRVYFVDDGSRDRTWQIIESLVISAPRFGGIKLSRNRGHQNALIAGLFAVDGDAVISVDADLQDDVNAIETMVDVFQRGADVVYGVRSRRESDTFFKRCTAETFYRIMRTLGAESVHNHADYRLLSRRAVESLRQYREVNLYLRGIVPLIGFKSEIVYYDRAARFAGQSKYPLRKMFALALEAVTSFSVTPLRFITVAGFVVFVGSMGVTAWALAIRIFTDSAIPGWTSIVLPMYFLGGVQIFCIGVLGEYLAKVYSEVKARPRYFIERVIPEGDTRLLSPRKVVTGHVHGGNVGIDAQLRE